MSYDDEKGLLQCFPSPPALLRTSYCTMKAKKDIWYGDTCFRGPEVGGRVVGDDVDVVLEVLQELVELLLTAAAVGIDLHLMGQALGLTRLNVVQIDVLLLLQGEEREERGEDGRRT